MTVFYDQNYIRCIDSVLDSELCADMIQRFEQDHQRHHTEGDRYIELDIFAEPPAHTWSPNTARRAQWQPLADRLAQLTVDQVSAYRQQWDPRGMLPDQWAMEGFRVKCYRPMTHEFRLHVDQANRASATRFIAVLIYLNDSDAGTEFPDLNLTIAARQGRMLIFPPNWQYPHRGLMPQTDTKYICSTYLHYKD
jgi:hypothetical protein